MIQELLGGAGIIGDGQFSINSALESSPSPSPSPSPSSSTITATAAAKGAVPASSSASGENQNLRCPRCSSSNTKFCYYNNYNLTQPRHFCKTCRRYWTKGGALRNVPIGGGCRKNKNVSVTSVAKSSPGRLRNASAEIGKAGGLAGGLVQELPSNPALWASPQNSQFLALLRATQNQNPNPNPISVKEETAVMGSHLTSNSMGRTLGLDLFNQDPGSFFWRNNQHQAQQQQQQQQNHHHHHHHHHQQHHQQQSGFILGEVQNTQEIYQRLRSTPNYYNPDHSPVVLLSNAGSTSSSTILESAPASAAELGYWNPALPWSDLPTSNGAYP